MTKSTSQLRFQQKTDNVPHVIEVGELTQTGPKGSHYISFFQKKKIKKKLKNLSSLVNVILLYNLKKRNSEILLIFSPLINIYSIIY